MVKQTLVLYPSPPIGHLISMVELGKLILKYHPSLSITVLVTASPYSPGTTAPYIDRVSKTISSIHFHYLPTISLPLDPSKPRHHETILFDILRLNNPLVQQALETISQISSIKALIIDAFCSAALEVAGNLNIPALYFFTSGISDLALFLYCPFLHETTTKSFKDIDAYLDIPGVPPILASDMPQPLMDRSEEIYEIILGFTSDLGKSQGIIVNSFESLEPRALKALTEGLCVPHAPTPPIYCIGPLIADGDGSAGNKNHECLSWLDSQPNGTVVLLSFGSMGLFSQAQLKEMAIGLEKSEQRFLWVVRSPATDDKTKNFMAKPEPDLPSILPEGFLDRTKDRGLVVKSWAPQVEVLSKPAIGGFVTHCGWNSVLEAVRAGVPMVAWPLYAEQRINKVFLVEEMKVALPMVEAEDGFVNSSEVEKRVRELMETNEGKRVREQTRRMSEAAKAALSESGSSPRALSKLAELWKVYDTEDM